MIQRMDFLAQQKMNELDSPPLPEKFSTFGTKWRLFKEAIHGHLAVKRGCIDVPLIYVLRDHQVVTDAMRDADYGDSDEYLINVVSLTTDAFKQDNARVWEIVRPLLYGTPAWDYVKTYDRTKNGRMALRVLERRGEGEAALDARRTKAETTLRKAQYTGKSKRFTLQSYINLLQGAFSELEECDPDYPLSERRKVDIFIKGLVADWFKVTRPAIIQNPETRNDFQAAYAFVETMENYNESTLTTERDGFDRSISEVKTGKSGNVDTSYRDSNAWSKLSKEEKDKILAARDKAGIKSKRKRKGNGDDKKNAKSYRKLAALAKEVVDQAGGAEGTEAANPTEETQLTSNRSTGRQAQGSNPANQFGRQAHALRRFAEAVASEFGDSGNSGTDGRN